MKVHGSHGIKGTSQGKWILDSRSPSDPDVNYYVDANSLKQTVFEWNLC